MSFVYNLARKIKKRNCFLIRIRCKCENIQELYYYLQNFAKRLVISNGNFYGPCKNCLSSYLNTVALVQGTEKEDIDYDHFHDFTYSPDNFCYYAIIFIGSYIFEN